MRILRRLGWIALWTAGVLVLVLATIFLGVRTGPGSRLVLRAGLGLWQREFVGELRVGRLETDLVSRIVLYDVEVRDPLGRPAASAARVSARFRLLPLLKRRLLVRDVEIEGGRAVARAMPDGRLNFAALRRPQPAKPEAPSRLRVEVEHARAALIARYEAPSRAATPSLQGVVELEGRATIGPQVDVEVRTLNVALEQPSSARLNVRGALTIDDALRLRRTSLELDAAGEALAPFVERPALHGHYHVALFVEGPLRALALQGKIETPGGPIHLDGQLRVGASFGWRGHLVARALDPRALVTTAPRGRLSVDASGQGVGRVAHLKIADARLETHGNKLAARGRLSFDGRLEGALDLDVDAPHLDRLRDVGLRAVGGAVTGRAHVERRRSTSALDAQLRARGLELPGLRIESLDADVRGANFVGTVSVAARQARIGRVALRTAELAIEGDRHAFSLRGAATGEREERLELVAHGSPRYRRQPWPSGVDAVVDRLDLDRGGRRWHLRPGATVAYERDPRGRTHADLVAALTGSALDGRDPLRAELQAHLDDEHANAKLHARAAAGSVALDASVPAVSSWSALRASRAPLRVKLDAELLSLARAYATLGLAPPARLATLEGKAKLHAELDRAEVEGQLSITFGSAQLPGGRLVARMRAQLASLWAQRRLRPFEWFGSSAPVHAELELAGLRLGALPLEALGLARFVNGGIVDGKGVVAGTLARPSVHLALSGKRLRRGSLRKLEARLVLDGADRETRILGILLAERSPLVQLAARLSLGPGAVVAGIPQDATIDARAVVPGFDLGRLEAKLPGLAGRVRGEAFVKGPLRDPRAKGELWVEGAAMGQTRLEALTLDFSRERGTLGAVLSAREVDGGTLHGTFGLRDGRVDAGLDAHAFKVDLETRGDVSPIRRLVGALDGRVHTEDSSLVGRLRVDASALAFTNDSREIKDTRLELAFSPGRVRIEQLAGRLGPGRFEVSGTIGLAGFSPNRVDLTVRTQKLPAVTHPVRVALDSTISIKGERQGDVLTGLVHVEQGSAKLPTITRLQSLQSTEPLADVVYVDPRGRARAEARARAARTSRLQATIEVEVPGPFHLRSKELDAELSGALTLRATRQVVGVSGELVAASGGTVTLFDRRYEIEHARLGFDGGPELDPSIDLKLTRQLSQAAISIEVGGTAHKPELHLSSQPPIYADSQILQAVLGGDPGQPTTDQGLDAKVSGAISGLIVGAVKKQLFPQLPIDVLKVEVGEAPGTTGGGSTTRLEVGKYLSDKVFVSYVHQFGAVQIGTRQLSANEAQLEWRFRRRFALDLAIGDAPSGRADLVWTIRY